MSVNKFKLTEEQNKILVYIGYLKSISELFKTIEMEPKEIEYLRKTNPIFEMAFWEALGLNEYQIKLLLLLEGKITMVKALKKYE